jgi:hypothetical protein
MTKYDIRLRRKSLTSGQIERHKDFKSLQGIGIYKQKKPSHVLIKILATVVGILILGGMIFFGVSKVWKKKDSVPKEVVQPDVFDEFKQ